MPPEEGLSGVELSEKAVSGSGVNGKVGDVTTSVDMTSNGPVMVDNDSGITREKWGKNIEFLLSCVALSVGFGNVWRFPYTALKNGGGAFVIPYLIVLFVVGRPLYYLEMVMGQFSSRGCVKVFDVSPLMRGVGVGQTITLFTIVGYYAAVLAIAVRYLVDSFRSPLPWTECQSDWYGCVSSSFQGQVQVENGTGVVSAKLYFDKVVVKLAPNLNDGIETPDWKLALCLLVCWICITAMLIKGIRSSGKASYFLAIFPYVILVILLGRACTLDGAADGILYFVTPEWGKLLEPNVWFEAVSQCFFSLTIGLGAVIVFSSFNSFSSNIYRDAMIISWLDTFTSIISGIIVFGVVGNLAHVTGREVKDFQDLGGPSLTFITYPDAIAKMDFIPNFFAVMFFLMFVVLGLGSNMGVVQAIMTSIRDRYPQVQTWKAVLAIAIAGFSCGLVYLTPAGLHVLGVVEYYGVTFASLTLVILETVTFCWIYGVNRICQDIKFMLNIETGLFWRVCWGLLTPAIIIAVFMLQIFKDADKVPVGYTVFGWCLYGFTVVLQMIGWGAYATSKQPEKQLLDKVRSASRPTEDWGPESTALKRDYDAAMQRYGESFNKSGNIVRRTFRRMFK
ncbi:sodium-dependent nutrient amino acid transporter 1-like [Culex pipiens pallens]|uniref:sodium-dependent nutrient amino acid transporter 1-like n=1 Tax=Culex pipiens pallens TaxID=42434 RepID=UPI001953B245|nr:sodium-dependent nutrient amino acid transporter 1-like [Culex pipiens pallens]